MPAFLTSLEGRKKKKKKEGLASLLYVSGPQVVGVEQQSWRSFLFFGQWRGGGVFSCGEGEGGSIHGAEAHKR